MIKKQKLRPYLTIGITALILIGLVIGFVVFRKPSAASFEAPRRTWASPKKVESYFVETMHMSPDEAKEIRWRGVGNDGTVDLRIGEDTTLQALVGNLTYYGFVRDEKTLLYALEHTTDTTPNGNAIAVSKTGSIDKNAEYRISEDMTAWKLADILLNKPAGHFAYDEYRYFFMP